MCGSSAAYWNIQLGFHNFVWLNGRFIDYIVENEEINCYSSLWFEVECHPYVWQFGKLYLVAFT